MLSTRVKLIEKYLNPVSLRILEIGALDSPTFRRPDFEVEYADYASRDDLSKKGVVNPRYSHDRLVNVDHIVPDGKYQDRIAHRFGLIVANHVIEHIADPIRWLNEMGEMLEPDGYIFLTIPDKNYTFDYLRREATVIDWLRAYSNRQSKPDFFNLLDHFWNFRPIKVKDIWEGNIDEKLLQRRFNGAQAVETALKHSQDAYADVHCYAYTTSSFKAILSDASEMGFLGFKTIFLEPIAINSNEFTCLLTDFNKARAFNFNISL